jgi:DNA-binding NarL/FixJ family response regulator
VTETAAAPPALLRVAIAEDSALVLAGIERLLALRNIEVVARTGSVDELLTAVAEQQPHAAIIDIRLPPTQTDEGLRAAALVRERHPGTAVLVLSQHLEAEYAMRLVDRPNGGVGYLLKESIADDRVLANAVRRVVGGEFVVDARIVSELMARRPLLQSLGELTERERLVLELMAQGLSNAAICARLHLASTTVETHIAHVFSKLGLRADRDENRRVLAVLAFLRR